MLGMEYDHVVQELTHLQNLLKERDQELIAAQREIEDLHVTVTLKEKVLDELQIKHNRLDEKLRITEHVVQQMDMEMKKQVDEKKEGMACQFVSEPGLRRLHVSQKDDISPALESIIAPLEAEIKMYKTEIASLQEDNKALERLTKSKEAVLLETEKILRSALERALIVEDIQNQNFDLKRQVEICQEENRLLEKANRQKVVEIEKLSQTIQELEEAVLASGAVANVIPDYKRQISELNEEKRVLERELARAKVTANRVATVVANEWKDGSDKVMPVKQWLEERRFFQAEMQRLKDKLAVAERTAKAEAQLKDKFKLRLNTLEAGLKRGPSTNSNANLRCIGAPRSPNFHQILGYLANNAAPKNRSTSQPRGSGIQSRSSPLHHSASGKVSCIEEKHASKNHGADHCGKENSEVVVITDANAGMSKERNSAALENMNTEGKEDVVSGFLYDRLQKEVISLRKTCETKDDDLSTKDEELKLLRRKVEALAKYIEVEVRKAKKETSEEHKAKTSAEKEENNKLWSKSFLKRVTKSS